MKNKTALILIDFQNEWVDKSSDYYVEDISQIIEKTNKLIDFARKNEWQVIFTKHIEKDSKKEFAPGSKNIEIIDSVNKMVTDTVIEKYKISSFYKTNMEEKLKGARRVVVCGILTNLCVRSFVQDAYDRGFEITIVKDCCVAFDKETHEFTLKDLKKTREEVEIVKSSKYI